MRESGAHMELGPEVLAAAVPVIAAFSGLVGHVTARRKSKVETDKLLVETAQQVVSMLSVQLKEQDARCSEHIINVTKESEDRCEERLKEAGRKRDIQYAALLERLRNVETSLHDERVEREEDRQAFIASWEDGIPPSKGVQ